VSARAAFVTHYYRADRPPFRNLSEVDSDDEATVLASLAEGSRRRFGPRYLALRRATEDKARELFVAGGGRPERRHPHYFVVGESLWFAGLYDQPREIRIPLDQLPHASTSFTWVDSITALGLGRELGVPQPDEPWKQQVYGIDQLDVAGAEATASPADTAAYEGHQWRLIDQYVEVQLWSDEPVRQYLGR
jgi:hypothetical protein